jgi:hypothetical protein
LLRGKDVKEPLLVLLLITPEAISDTSKNPPQEKNHPTTIKQKFSLLTSTSLINQSLESKKICIPYKNVSS